MGFRRIATASNILEKLAKSLTIWWFNHNWLPAGMIKNDKSAEAEIIWASPYVILSSGAVMNGYAQVIKEVQTAGYGWGKRRLFSVYVQIVEITTQFIHIVTGGSSYGEESNLYQHVGFKVINGTLYGTVANGSAESTLELETLTEIEQERALEVEFKPNQEARFYVDGVDKGAITTNLPSGTTHAAKLFMASVRTNVAEARELYVYSVKACQME